MTHFLFATKIKIFVNHEVEASRIAYQEGDANLAFSKLERAHVLGQASTVQHVRVHCLMLLWAFRQRNLKELMGQIFRIVGAATKTVFGLVPSGNTGGTNISPFKRLPIAPELASIIARAKYECRDA